MSTPAGDSDWWRPPGDTGFRYLGDDLKYRGYAVAMVVAHVEDPTGERFTRDVLRHPGAVAVLPLHDDDTVTLVRQYRAPIDATVLEIPAGVRDVEGEDDAATARRELIEEAGLDADHVELLTRFHNAVGASDELCAVYLATGLRPVADDRQGVEEEHMEVVRVPLAELVAAIEHGAITDAKTVIAALLTARRRDVRPSEPI